MIRKVAAYGNVLMMVTSIHHVYGAYVYDTPWRLHVLAFSIPIIAFNWYVSKKYKANKTIFYTFCGANLIITISLIGLFEGVYNHLVKNVLFYWNTDPETMARLFPPPKYVLPNDFVFEFTGILQALLVIPLLYYFVRLIQSKYKANDNVY